MLKVLCAFNVIAATLSTVAKEERSLGLRPITASREQIQAKSSIWEVAPNCKRVLRLSVHVFGLAAVYIETYAFCPVLTLYRG